MSTAAPLFRAGTRVRLPQLAQRLPVRCHPGLKRIRRRSNRWVREHLGFALTDGTASDHFFACDYGLWTCLILPTSIEKRALDACDWTQYFFMFDNVCSGAGKLARQTDSARELFGAIKAIVCGQEATPGDAYATAFEDAWLRITSPMPAGQARRFAASVDCFLNGCLAEVGSRAAGRILDFETYMRTRHDSVGGKMYFLLAEHGLGIDLTDALPGSLPGTGPLGELTATALDYLILTNDLFSFRAECTKGDFVNAVSAFVLHDGLSLQGSIDKLCEVIDARECDFLAQRAAILRGPLASRPDVQAYVEALGYMMAGNLHWSYLTPRYHGLGHVWNGASSGTLTLYTDRTVFEGS
jgi:hypothetical protein